MIGPRVRLQRNVRLAADVSVGDGTILGGDPQDLKYQGEETWVEIGEGTIIREYSTINRGTSATYRTVVGARCFIMTYVHLAHDCHVGDDVIIANGTQCAGHVTIHDRAILSGLNAIHQFVTIGTYAFVGGGSRVNQDIPPYVKAVGNPMELYGLNSIGLQRAGFSGETIAALKRAYRLFFNSDLNLSQALERARTDLPPLPEVERFLDFVESSRAGRAGVTRPLPVGVIGVGALGRHHARHLAQLEGARLVGVNDIDSGRARAVAEELGTDACDAGRAAGPGRGGHRRRPDAGPRRGRTPRARARRPGAHGEAARRHAGGSGRLIAAAAAKGVQLQVGHIERYNRAIRAAEPYLDGPRYIESLRLAPFQPRGTDVAVVLDLMIHDLDLVLHLTGGAEATEVRASGLSVLSSHLDIANARVEFANGAVALATASRVSRERVRRLRLFQPNGYFSLDLATGGGEFMQLRSDWRPGTGSQLADVVERVVLEAPEADALALELQSFVHAVRGEREVVVGGAEGRAALALALRVADVVKSTPAGRTRGGMITRAGPRIFVSAGEPSGDLHGAGVVRALRERYPDASIEALGGPRMAQAGATLRYEMEGLAAFGFVEVVSKLGAHLRLLRALRQDLRAGRYDLVILIDYPGFHLRVAEAARAAGTKVLYYIAPQLWAWRPERARRLAAAVDRLAVVLPFEQPFFGGLGLRSEYVGHPLVDRAPAPTRAAARESLGIPPGSRVLGLFPGSRAQEIRRLWAPFRDAARALARGRPLRPGARRRDRVGPVSGARPGRDRARRSRAGSWPPRTRRWSSRARRRWRRRCRTRPWSSRTRSTRSPTMLPAGADGGVDQPGEPGGRIARWCPSCSRTARRPSRWPMRSGRCSIRTIPAPRPSTRAWRWCESGWASRAPRRGWWRSPEELLGA